MELFGPYRHNMRIVGMLRTQKLIRGIDTISRRRIKSYLRMVGASRSIAGVLLIDEPV